VAFPVGTHIDLAALPSQPVVVTPASGVSVNGVGTQLRAVYSAGSLIKYGTNTWLLAGDIQ